MVEKNPALFIASESHASADFRRYLAAMFGDSEGVYLSGDLAVTEKAGGANLSVDVASGRFAVLGTEGTYQGTYFGENQATLNVVVDPAHATLGRIDVIAARIQDSAYSGATDAWDLHYIVGTADATPAAPAIDANSLKLCEITVAALASSIVNANIADSRVRVFTDHIENYMLGTGVVDSDELAAGGVDLTALEAGIGNRDIEVFTADGTFTKANYAWARYIKVRLVSGGGGSGGVAVSSSGVGGHSAGGGGGGYAEELIPIASVGTTETVTVGAGGAGGSSGNSVGLAGASSSFGSHCSATGGAGGDGSPANAGATVQDGGVGGVGTGGDVNIPGSDGGDGYVTAQLGPAATGHGGDSMLGTTARSDGTIGNVYGGGGSGRMQYASQAAQAGYAGADGICIVEVFG